MGFRLYGSPVSHGVTLSSQFFTERSSLPENDFTMGDIEPHVIFEILFFSMNISLAIAALIALYFVSVTPSVLADNIKTDEAVITELENMLSSDPSPPMTETAPEMIGDRHSEPVAQPTEANTHTAPHWGYSGATAPDHWGELDEDYALCAIGHAQSPIDLNADLPAATDPITFNYATVTLEVVNNGHTIQVNYPKGSTATINGATYNLVQLHFHAPSEHTIDHTAHPMEVHLVHRNDAGQLAVIGVEIDAGDRHNDVSKIWRNIPAEGETKRSGLVVYAGNLLPEDKSYVSYRGSLTTPPCSEDVTWIVMKNPITLSEEQIKTFQALYPMNARPVQPHNGRLETD